MSSQDRVRAKRQTIRPSQRPTSCGSKMQPRSKKTSRKRKGDHLLPVPVSQSRGQANWPVLRCENATEFEQLLKEFERDIRPTGAIERMYVRQIAEIIWEIRRYRRHKMITLDRGFHAALMGHFSKWCNNKLSKNQLSALAESRITQKAIRPEIAAMLGGRDIDEAAVEAQVLNLHLDYVANLDTLLADLEFRRDKAFRMISDYRESFAAKVWASIAPIMDAKTNDVRQVEYRKSEKVEMIDH